MRYYLVRDNRVTVCSAAPASMDAEAVLLQSIKDLDVRRFPIARLIAMWNALPAVDPVKRFKDRGTAVRRLWNQLEKLPISSARTHSKQARLIALLSRPSGVELEEMMSATGWKAHSVRGLLSGVLRKKLGLPVVCERDGNQRIYRIER